MLPLFNNNFLVYLTRLIQNRTSQPFYFNLGAYGFCDVKIVEIQHFRDKKVKNFDILRLSHNSS